MPTNEERREVARRLREMDFEGAFDLHEKMEMVGEVIGDPFSDMLVNDFTNRLADLIEPEPERTCKPNVWCEEIVECHGLYERWLAECGSCVAILSEASSEERARICLPNYCPNCGAQVIKHDD